MKPVAGHRRASPRARTDEVCIVGAGAFTPAGHTLAASAAAVRAGLPCTEEHPSLTDSYHAPVVVGRASRAPSWRFSPAERVAHMAVSAARESIRAIARRSFGGPLPAALFVAMPEDRPGRPDDLDEVVGSALARSLGKWLTIGPQSLVRAGHAGGLALLESAMQSIRAGEVELALVGGVDSYLEAETLSWLEDARRLHTEDNPWGFVPGEGAGFVLLSGRKSAERRGIEPLATLVAVRSAIEPVPRGAKGVCTGVGLTAALRGVLETLPDEKSRVALAIADLNGEPYRVDEIGFAVVRTATRFDAPGDVLAPATCWGDLGAASGPLFLGLMLRAANRGHAGGPLALAWAGSDHGARAAALVRLEALAPQESR